MLKVGKKSKKINYFLQKKINFGRKKNFGKKIFEKKFSEKKSSKKKFSEKKSSKKKKFSKKKIKIGLSARFARAKNNLAQTT